MSTWLAVFGARRARNSNKWAAFHRRDFGESDIGHFARQSFKREIFSQRKIWIALPNQDPTQIGMPVEFDSHHVVSLPLMPVRRRPDVGNSVDRVGLFRNF